MDPQFRTDSELIAWLYSMSEHADFGDPMRRAFHQAAETIKRLNADPALSGWFYCQACGERNDVEPKGGRFLGA